MHTRTSSFGLLLAGVTMTTELEEPQQVEVTISGGHSVPPLFQRQRQVSVASIGGFLPLDPPTLYFRPCGIFLVLSHWDSLLKTCVVGMRDNLFLCTLIGQNPFVFFLTTEIGVLFLFFEALFNIKKTLDVACNIWIFPIFHRFYYSFLQFCNLFSRFLVILPFGR